MSAGMHAAWIKRSADMIFDPWEIGPNVTVADITELREAILNYKGSV
jgi:2-haloacid dehalogenase